MERLCIIVWILQPWRCIDGSLRFINLGQTKWDISEGLDVKCTGLPLVLSHSMALVQSNLLSVQMGCEVCDFLLNVVLKPSHEFRTVNHRTGFSD